MSPEIQKKKKMQRALLHFYKKENRSLAMEIRHPEPAAHVGHGRADGRDGAGEVQVELIVGDAVLVVDGDRAVHGEGQAGVLVVPPEARGPQVRAMPLLQGVAEFAF